MIICLGPICIPLWGLLPFLTLFLGKIKTWLRKTFFGSADATVTSKKVKKPGSMRFGNCLRPGTEEEIRDIIQNNLTIIKFTASWCQPCARIQPLVVEMARENPEIAFVIVDIEDMHDFSKSMLVSSMPTFVAFAGGNETQRFISANEEKLKSMVSSLT